MSLKLPQQTPLFAAYADAARQHGKATGQMPLPTPPKPVDDASTNETVAPRPARLRFCVLGSGSGGNCSVVHIGEDAILLDAGLGPRTIGRRLRSAKLDLNHIKAVLLTHLDSDHFRPTWINTLLYQRIRLCVHRWHSAELQYVPGIERLIAEGLVELFNSDPFELLPDGTHDVTVRSVRLPHDKQGTTGYHLDTASGTVGYATDLGSVPHELINRFAGVDLLAIESNYDPEMQRGSGRPLFLQRRIMGRQGHLSNQQSFEAVRAIFDRSEQLAATDPHVTPPHSVVLLHRSTQCNCPRLLKEMFDQDPRIGPKVVLAEQRRRTRWLNVQSRPASPPSQLGLQY